MTLWRRMTEQNPNLSKRYLCVLPHMPQCVCVCVPLLHMESADSKCVYHTLIFLLLYGLNLNLKYLIPLHTHFARYTLIAANWKLQLRAFSTLDLFCSLPFISCLIPDLRITVHTSNWFSISNASAAHWQLFTINSQTIRTLRAELKSTSQRKPEVCFAPCVLLLSLLLHRFNC